MIVPILMLSLCLVALPAALAIRFSAVGVPVSDLARSEAFYSSALGFKPYRTIKTSEYDEIIMIVPGAGAAATALVLMQYKKSRNVTNLPGKLVFNADNVTTTIGLLKVAGAKVLNEPGTLKIGNTTLSTAFVKDLDGHVIEINPMDAKF